MKEFKGYKRGINLGGWLSQCGNDYTEHRYSTYITREDIATIAGWGLDHFRLPFDYHLIQNDDGSFRAEGFKHLDDALAWAKEFNLNVVLDLHKCCGFVFDDESYCDFFSNEKLQNQFIDLWKEMAIHYGSLSYVCFELLNEVTAREMAEPWNAIIKKTVPEIRKIAPNVTIIVGGIFNSSIYGLSLMEAPCDSNMVYTFHCYNPFIFTHQAAGWVAKMPKDIKVKYPKSASELQKASSEVLGSDFDGDFVGLGDEMVDYTFFTRLFKDAIAVAEKYDVPLYCGEYGVIDFADPESTVNWYEDIHKAFEETGIGRSAWTYKLMDFGVTQEHLKSVYPKIVEILGR